MRTTRRTPAHKLAITGMVFGLGLGVAACSDDVEGDGEEIVEDVEEGAEDLGNEVEEGADEATDDS